MYANSILSYYSEAMHIKAGKMPIPRMVLFSLSSKCNASCPYCIYGGENKHGKVIDEAIAFDVINQLHQYGVKAIDLCGGGDPLTTPYFDKLAFHIHQRNMKFGVISNGINLTDDNMKNIIQFGSYVRISYDSADKEIYKTMKVVDKAEQVFNNLISACKYRDQIQSKCEISVKIGISQDNVEIPGVIKTIQALKALPLNRITVRLLRNTDKEIIDTSALDNLQNTIMLYDGADNKPICNVNFNKSMLEGKCWLNPIHSVITDSGEVYLCCYYVGREKQHSIGNIHKNTFADIWEGKEHFKKLEGIDKKICDVYDCKFHSHNKIMADFIENGTPEFM